MMMGKSVVRAANTRTYHGGKPCRLRSLLGRRGLLRRDNLEIAQALALSFVGGR
jgi:hypothetical protein